MATSILNPPSKLTRATSSAPDSGDVYLVVAKHATEITWVVKKSALRGERKRATIVDPKNDERNEEEETWDKAEGGSKGEEG